MIKDKNNLDDQAWVTIDSALPVATLREFCNDIEQLFRINPYLEFSCFQHLDTNTIFLKGKNLSNQQTFELKAERQALTDGYILIYQQGLKRSTSITVNTSKNGSQIKICDDYSGTSEQERNQRLHEVDKSIQAWGQAINDYLKAWQRWSGFLLWRWYKKRLWLPMKPSARRISWMLINITTLEFLAFLMVFTIFWLELDRYFGI